MHSRKQVEVLSEFRPKRFLNMRYCLRAIKPNSFPKPQTLVFRRKGLELRIDDRRIPPIFLQHIVEVTKQS